MKKVFLATFVVLVVGSTYAYASGSHSQKSSDDYQFVDESDSKHSTKEPERHHSMKFSSEVPEIDALSGLAALAVLGGALSLFWERRRRK